MNFYLQLNKILIEKKFENFELMLKRTSKKTILKFLKKNPELKIALIHLDIDVYNPTKFALDTVFG